MGNDILQVQGINSKGYGIIPKLVMQDKRLTTEAKAIYGYFCSYAGAGRTAFPTWWARITLGKDENGKQKRKAFYGKTRKEVQEKLTSALNDVNKDMYIEQSSMTVSQWLAVWLKEYKKPVLRATTYRTYTELFKWHITPYLGDVKLKNLRNDMVQRAINELVKKGVSAYTIRSAHETFYGALEQAVKNELVSRNVSTGVNFPEIIKKAFKSIDT